MRRLLAAATVLAGVLAVQAVAAAPAAAHAELVSASPGNGAMLAGPPDEVELVFSETVGRPAELLVLGPDGSEVAGGELTVVDRTLQRTYDPAAFEPGSYTVSYQVTSADGHAIAGTLSFMVHADGETMDESAGAVTGTGGNDSDPTTVALLAVCLAVALGITLLITRRMLAGPEGAGTG
jgi:methionine-rich copper-binding protein CopC